MDKLIDAGNLVSLVSGNKPETTRTRGESRHEGDPFSKVLEQETGKSDKLAEKSRETISNDKKDDKSTRTPDPRATELEEKLKGKLNLKAMDLNSMANYLYSIALKNPDSMNLSEKQAFKLGEFSPDGVGLKEFQKMLTDRGMKLSDLNFSQLAQLTQRNSRGTINAFLDEMLRQMKDGKAPNGSPLTQTVQQVGGPETTTRDEKEKKSTELQAASQDNQPQPYQANLGTPQASPAEQLFRTPEDQRRQELRESIIDQILARVDIKTVGDKTEMTLKLNPEYLGDMRVKLSTQNGKLTAEFETTSPEVRELIEEGWDGLKEKFAGKGLNLINVGATVVDRIG